MPCFNHLHCHTQFSLLDGAANISDMLKKAVADDMKAVAITDHGNMFGVFQFVNEANKQKIKPIVGCEFYLVENRFKKQFTKPDKDIRYHQVLLAKNAQGYQNLSKLCSLGWIEGKYGNYPRIDRSLIEKYKDGLIATTCCLAAEVPRAILKKSEEEAEKVFLWWYNLFGDDYFVELQRHGIPEQEQVNQVLLKFSKKYNVPIIASNDSHYVDQEDASAHEILLAINTGSKMSDPSSKDLTDDDESVNKGRRFAFYNDEFFFKTKAQMSSLFHDLPHAIDNTNLVVDKIETLSLKKDILLPNFPLPDGFTDQWEYLRHISFEGAIKRYGEITPEVEERLNFELFTIKTMGFAGYFLIVSDFIKAGRDMGVFVGPGRGSAAGSVVAYCIGITNIDPIKYNLLFERFLNPDRKSMPDIDTDFDDEGRQRVIDYVVDKYGKNQVAQIVTYGTMAAKMSIKDVARVMDLPLDESNMLAKLVPEKPGITLKRIFHAPLTAVESEQSVKSKLEEKTKGKNLEQGAIEEVKKKIQQELKSLEEDGLLPQDLEQVKQLREIYNGAGLRKEVLHKAEILEGSVRSTGVHAAGVIIAPSDLTTLMPLATAKDSDLLLTQYEGKVIEDAGVIKMDFLGLKTLTIIKKTLKLIEKNHGINIDIDNIDLHDEQTFKLFAAGDTDGIFQFENPGLQKYLRDLKPDKLEDLIALTALYRPGPMQYVPTFIARKNGHEPIVYDLDEMKEYLEETYGVTVYQEQVMLLSQKLAGFTKGDADTLRKAMGKKDKATLDKMKSKFLEGTSQKGFPKEKVEKIWADWEHFAQYAFNKSHATCYAFVAYQVAWLKAHYPSEFIAANLTNEKDNIEKVTYFLEAAKRCGIKVLGPDINESSLEFDVNKKGEIRFGLGAIKGTGEAAVSEVILQREKSGNYIDVFDFAARVNLRTVNKKTFESFALAGAFDFCTDIHRAVYFYKEPGEDQIFIEKLIRYGQVMQDSKNSMQNSLFGVSSAQMSVPKPKIPNCEPWGDIEKLRLEKEVVGFFISGHPLDEFKIEFKHFVNCSLDRVVEFMSYTEPDREAKYRDLLNKDLYVAGIVTSAQSRVNKKGMPFGIFKLEDYKASHEFMLFGEDYLKNSLMLTQGTFVYVKARIIRKEYGDREYQFKPLTVELLQDVRSKRAKRVTLHVTPAAITPMFIDTLENILATHTGGCEIKLKIENNVSSVEMYSRKYRVEPSNGFFQQLEALNILDTKISH